MSVKSPLSSEYDSRSPSSGYRPSPSADALNRSGFSRENGAFEERPTYSDELFLGSAPPRLWRDPGLLTFVASGAVLVIGWLIALSGGRELFAVAAYLLATVVGSYLFMRQALARLILRRQLTLDLWIGVVIAGSVLISEFALGAFLAFVYSITQVGVSMWVGGGPE